MASASSNLSGYTKTVLPLVFYGLTDYYYNRFHLRERFVNPIPACYAAGSHALILLILSICNYYWYRKVRLPNVNVSLVLTSLSLSFLLRCNVFDLNHNFGEPAYKNITAILFPLILLYHGAEKYGCLGAFLAILLSSISRIQPLPVNQVLIGGVLSLTAQLCLCFLNKCRQEKQDGIDDLNHETKMRSFLEVSSNLFLGIVFCDIIVALFEGDQSDSYNGFGVTGMSLFALSSLGKFVLLYFSTNCGVHALMVNWVSKTIMFSFTYTLGYKFDLTISNLLAMLLWAIYVIIFMIVSKFKEQSSSSEVKYVPVLSHID